MKAIIPVAGAGTKLRPHTYTQPKALIPIAGKTILSFIVDQLQEAGIREFVFVVGYLGEKIHEYVQHAYPHLTTHFVYQNERQGTGHAVKLAHEIIGNDEVMVVLGDTICEYDVREIVNSPYNMLGVKKVDDPRVFGVAEMNEDDQVERVVEKPAIPKSNMALVGLYKIKDSHLLFECIGQWFDCGKKESLLESNATLLKKFGGNTNPNSHQFENTIIIPPVSIGTGCNIKNAIIGPHVSIGSNTTVNYSIIRDSIVGSYTSLYEVVLDNSLIGSDASVKGLSRNLNIGDNTEIDFG